MTPCTATDAFRIPLHQPKTTSRTSRNTSRSFLTLMLFFSIQLMASNSLFAQNPGYYNADQMTRFFFSAGIGYGLANNPVTDPDESKTRGGLTLSATLGYRFTERFSIGFGPSFWIEGRDVADNSASNNESPANKRTTVTVDGYFKPVRKIPLQLRLGAGVGSFVYTPGKNVVSADNNGISKTEITGGFAANAGVVYQISLGEKISLFPSVNFWYGNLERQKIQYETLIDHKKSSLVSDIRINAFLFF